MFNKLSNSQRIIINTSAQYTKTVVNTFMSFYATRLILGTLGVNDFGLYSLLAGVIALLAFITNALINTTQRYLNFYQGKNEIENIRIVLGNSIVIHLFLGIAVLIFIELLGLIIFDGFLNISENRMEAARFVYHCMAFMLLTTFVAAPFRALIVSHENIVYISLIDIIDGILKLGIALILPYFLCDKLQAYAVCMLFLPIVNLIAFGIYDFLHYEECRRIGFKSFSLKYVKDLLNYAGWMIYSTGCIVMRTQGMAVLLNRYVGMVANAAYGIAIQVSGAIAFISSSFLNAVNPQLIKAEGAGNRNKMLFYAEIESKYSFLLLSMLVVPCIIEMPFLLRLWLGNVPDYAIMMCRIILMASLVDQITIGLGSANQAIGKIRNYSLVINSLKLLTLPAAFICIKLHYPLTIVMANYVCAELLCAIVRLPFVSKTAGFPMKYFIRRVFLKVALPFSVFCLTSIAISALLDSSIYRVFITFIFPNILYVLIIYFFSLTDEEKLVIKKIR